MHQTILVTTVSLTNYHPPLHDVVIQQSIEEVLMLTDAGYQTYQAERTRTVHNSDGWVRQISEPVAAPDKLLKELNLL